MKVGDKLVCKDECFGVFTIGNTYIILDISEDRIFLSPNNSNGLYWFMINDDKYHEDNEFYYGKYFTCLRELRLNKLKKLSSISKYWL
jgi:hypothetical protein